ncbi:MAG: hypothetical protein ACOCVL_04090, partial [Candidatus Sumerlaeota bacterium]
MGSSVLQKELLNRSAFSGLVPHTSREEDKTPSGSLRSRESHKAGVVPVTSGDADHYENPTSIQLS